jgi:hypothetical protein
MQTMNIGQVVQPAVLSNLETTAKNLLKQWWNARSESFSLLAGESFTHGQVIIANACLLLGLIAMMGAVALVSHIFGMEGGAL